MQLSGQQQVAQDEQAARARLLIKLRAEYIASHDGISPAMLSGTEHLPKDWVEKRLAALGVPWRQNVYW